MGAKPTKQAHPTNEEILIGLFVVGLAALLLAVFSGDKNSKSFSVKTSQVEVLDGDTLRFTSRGKKTTVRLFQINAPELDSCYGKEASDTLSRLVRKNKRLTFKYDSKLDATRFNRLLVYVYAGKRNLNIALVRKGAAREYFINDERGDYANKILKATKKAKADAEGLWGTCTTNTNGTGGASYVGDGPK